MTKIAASILSADFTRLGDEVREAEAAGVDRLHLDIMDGHFVPTLSYGPMVAEALARVTKLPLEAHLMVEAPERQLQRLVKAGVGTLILHWESSQRIESLLGEVKALQKRVGLSLKPGTPPSEIEPLLHQVDLAMVMTVEPGVGGQDLILDMLGKVTLLRQLVCRRGLSCEIEVDGGVNARTAPLAVKAGADTLVIGSAIFATDASIGAAVRRIRCSLKEVAGPSACGELTG